MNSKRHDPHSNDLAKPAATPVPLLDVLRQNAPYRQAMLDAVASVVDSGRFLYGAEVNSLEESIAELCQSQYAIGCASGSDALLLALMAGDVGPGDEVILPSFTFFATASAVWRLGAKPVFVDIERDTFNMSPAAMQAAITDRTKAVIPVHLFGQCARIDTICQIARQHKLMVVEDAAQAIGASYRGKPAGSWGNIGCFSFYPTKNLGGCGDGGMLTTCDEELQQRLRLLASHGMKPRYYHSQVGINSRLDSIQAALLLAKLEGLAPSTRQRQANADRYATLLENAVQSAQIVLPVSDPENNHVWNQYTIRVPDGRRDALREFLAARKIGTEIYYPVPLHQQQCFAALDLPSLPETEAAAGEVLSLPIFGELRQEEQDAVARAICEFCTIARASAA